jgi:hypothetical protein
MADEKKDQGTGENPVGDRVDAPRGPEGDPDKLNNEGEPDAKPNVDGEPPTE